MNLEVRKDLLKSMNAIAINMRDIIYRMYFDSYDKYVLSMFDDAFNGIDLVCSAIQNVYISQAALLIRQLLEQVSVVQILVTHPELLNSYKEHYKLKIEIVNLNKDERKQRIIEKFNIPLTKANENFLDYGWIDPNYVENDMIEFAGFGDFIPWKTSYLNKFTHSSIVTNSAIGDGSFPIVNDFIEMVVKLFDHLCCAFHNYTNYKFESGDKNLFQEFRSKYITYNKK